MAPNSAHLLLLAVLSIIAVTAIASGKLGIFEPVVRTDPKLTELAKFAVEEHNKEGESALVFDRVAKGEAQKVSSTSTNYKISIFAKDGGAVHTYTAIVYCPSGNKPMRLYSFNQK